MPTYDVVSGDTVWALSRRALTEYLGRPPTNREVLEIVNQVQVPSGDVNLIFPGEQVTIPVGPNYGPDIDSEGGGQGTPPRPPVRGGAGPIGPGAGDAQYPSDMYPDGPYGPGSGGTGPIGTGDPVRDAALADFAETGEWPNPLVGTGWEAYHRGPPLGLNTQQDMEALARATALAAGGAVAGRGIGALLGRFRGGAAGAGGQPALPSGQRPALPAGPAGGYPAAGGGRMPFQFGAGPQPSAGAAARSRFPSENEIRAGRNVIPQRSGGRGTWQRDFGSGGYTY